MAFNWFVSKLTREQVAAMIEEWVNDPSIPLEVLAKKYNTRIDKVSRYITEICFGGGVKKEPVIITIQSKINN